MREVNSTYLPFFALIIVFAVLISLAACQGIANGNLTAHFLDVGQGDSILIQCHNKSVLIDSGEQDMGPRVSSYLQNHGIKEINLLVATHPHSDHIGGLSAILNNFKVDQVLDSGQAHPSPIYESFLTLIDQKNIPYKVAEREQTIDIDPSIKIEVLSPPPNAYFQDLNAGSIVLKVVYNKIVFLLMSDAVTEAENNIMASGYDLKSDILKVGHHGSATSTGTIFLNKVLPSISVIEVGEGNDYGHPKPETLKKLQEIGSKIYRTDLYGNIEVTTDGETFSVTTQKTDNTNRSVAPYAKPIRSSSSAVAPAGSSSSHITEPVSSQRVFVGSTKSNKYHYLTCSSAKAIKSENKIWFSSSEDARAKGYVPCGKCHPP